MEQHRHYIDEVDGHEHTHELGELGAAGTAETDELRTRVDILERDRDDQGSELDDLDQRASDFEEHLGRLQRAGELAHQALTQIQELAAKQAEQIAELRDDVRGLDKANDDIRSDLGRAHKRIGELTGQLEAAERTQARATRRLADEISQVTSGAADL
jgi:chromosome segregation ATPase